MGRAPCCDKANVKKGPWSPEEDKQLKEYTEKHGTGGNWIALPHKAGLKRCGKSCRLRWLNYLRPNIKHGDFSDDEDRIICSLYASIGSRWSIIASQLPGRTDNDIKNYWNTKLKKKLLGIPPPHKKPPQHHKNQQPQFSSVDTSSSSPIVQLEGGLATISPCLFNSLASTAQFPVPEQTCSLIKFGGDQSCSSSDASCSNMNHISTDQDLCYRSEMMRFENYVCGGMEEAQKPLLGGVSFNFEDEMKPLFVSKNNEYFY